jgi:ABC-type polysaccharide/polyol phosphate transport system ATPase subunit
MDKKVNRISETCMTIISLNIGNTRVSGEAEQCYKSFKGNAGWKTS